jgi:hypothetical protein
LIADPRLELEFITLMRAAMAATEALTEAIRHGLDAVNAIKAYEKSLLAAPSPKARVARGDKSARRTSAKTPSRRRTTKKR